MKAILFISTFLLSVTLVGFAQDVKEQDVPAVIKQALRIKYPGITAKKWTKEKDVYEAEVILESKECEVAFSEAGNWLETEREIKIDELPDIVTSAIVKSDYKMWTLKEAELIESSDRMTSYEVELKKGSEKIALLFSATGEILKIEKD